MLNRKVLALSFCLTGLAAGQNSSSLIFGSVTDSSGAVLAGVTVTVTQVDTHSTESVITNSDGNYIFPALRPGSFSVSSEKMGFRKTVRSGVVLEVNQRARVDLALQLGEVKETVAVTADATTVDTFSATLKEVVDSKRMVDMPLNGRQSLQLQNVLPGAVQTRSGQAATLIALNTNLSFSINGSRGNANSYFLDGGINMDTYNNLATAFPNPDTLQEFSILQNSYSAVNGRNSGAVVNAITKSGSNQLHGTLYEFLRNDKLNTRNFFALGKAPLRKNQFGGTVGGPVRIPKLYNGRDKTFIFFAYEGGRERNGTTRSNIQLPSARERQGDFSQSRIPTGRVVGDPLTVTVQNQQGTPFPGNIVPANRLDPIAQNFTKAFFPLPNLPNDFYSYNFSVPLDDDQVTLKIDHMVSAKNRLSLRWFYDDFHRTQNEALEAFNAGFDWATHNLNLNDTHILTPNIVNTFTLTWNRNTFIRAPLPTAGAKDWAELGCRNCPYLAPSTVPPDWAVAITNGFNVRVSTSFFSYMQNYQIIDNMSVTHGNHLFTFGTDIAKVRRNGREYFQVSPQLGFDGTRSGSLYGYADFFLGTPTTVYQNSPLRSNPHKWTPFLYFQDDWKISRRLMLNIGLRWEPFFPLIEERDDFSAFRPGRQSKVYPLAPPGLLFPGDDGIERGIVGKGLKKFSPRFGFAWDPRGNGKTSIRGGYGIFYDTLRLVGINNYSTKQPFSLGLTTFNPFSLSDLYRNSPQIPQLLSDYGSSTIEQRRSRPFVLPAPASSIDSNFTTGYMQQWNLSVQREIAKEFVLGAAYVASKGTHLWVAQDINPGIYIPNQSTSGNIDSRRLYPGYQQIQNLQPTANSTYHSLQITWKKRLSRGFSVLGSYAWSKFIDLASSDINGNSSTDPYNWSRDKGLSDFNIRHRFTTSFIYELPIFNSRKGVTRALLGGWQVNGIIALQTGQPFSVFAGSDQGRVGGTSRADAIKPATTFNGNSRGEKIQKFFDTTAFVVPAVGSHGNTGRNILSAPGLANVDFSAFKQFRVREGKHFQFRWEFFNLFNRANFDAPINSVTNGAFGRLISARDPRIMQAGLKFIY